MPANLTPKEVAVVLRSSVFHVRHLIASGELPASRSGKRRLLVAEGDLQKFLEARRVGNPLGEKKEVAQ